MNSRISDRMSNRARGVTLMELVMVLVIAAIVVSWAFPWLTQSIQNNQMASQNISLGQWLERHYRRSQQRGGYRRMHRRAATLFE
jgi:prepilin-type N-terminal cleavage/methylation domain-containing protein